MSAPSKKLGFVEQVILLALMISMVALSIDVMLPALFNISQDLHAEHPNDRQYIIAAVFLGLAIGQLFYGPLSDSTGRKPAIYIGFGLFLIGCLLSIFAENFTVMLIGRLLQGLGVASPRIVSLALIRDQYEGREMARFVSLVMTVFILVPVLAPALGQLILIFAEWRMIFVALFILGLATLIWFSLRQEETLAVENRARLLLEVLEGVTNAWDGDHVGLRLSPFSPANDIADDNPQETFEYVVRELNKFGLAYLHMVEGSTGQSRDLKEGEDLAKLRKLFDGVYMANNLYDRDMAIKAVADGAADLVAFGRPYIANPDLAKRLERDAPLNEGDTSTFYAGGKEGFTDYPFLEEIAAE